ncbi:hypothetical protein N658DRAFT_500110 [Parathielavia hyrcaniae]|uniref:Uncharacterized protein n=1 Tax=Parathielavia hyrcaniae TaxID=113614 RepID=A0AAN6SY89_9PEZI|nr:hypothetical protein N658DRAFT_500110 [Parathielavia hyrcaniae]
MESYEHLDPQLDGLDLGIFSATGPQTFLSQPGAPHGPSPGFHTPELSSQARGYPPRSYGYQGVPRFPPQAPGAGRPVNIVLPNGGTEAQRYVSRVYNASDSTDGRQSVIDQQGRASGT